VVHPRWRLGDHHVREPRCSREKHQHRPQNLGGGRRCREDHRGEQPRPAEVEVRLKIRRIARLPPPCQQCALWNPVTPDRHTGREILGSASARSGARKHRRKPTRVCLRSSPVRDPSGRSGWGLGISDLYGTRAPMGPPRFLNPFQGRAAEEPKVNVRAFSTMILRWSSSEND
jgi:hypothetical protein